MKNITELRIKVMTIANRIRKTNKLSLSQAVKRAWNMAKIGLTIKVAGVTQGNRQVACEHLQRYDIADIKV